MNSDLNVKLQEVEMYVYLTILSLFSMAGGCVVQWLANVKIVHAVLYELGKVKDASLSHLAVYIVCQMPKIMQERSG